MMKFPLMLLAASVMSAATVTVSDTLVLPDGTNPSGRLIIGNPTFTTASGTRIAASARFYAVTNGVINLTLESTTDATPAGVSYNASYLLDTGRNYSEVWVIPTTGPVTIADIVTDPAPSPTVIINPGVLTQAGAATNECLVWSGAEWAPGSCSVGGSGLTSLGSQTGSTQTFANDTNVTISSAADTHTLGWTGTLGLARGGSAADLSATGGANQVVRQNSAGGALTVSALADADIPDTITLSNLTQVTTRAYSDLQSIPSTFAPSGHATSHQNAGSDEVATATAAANAIPKAGAGGTLTDGWIAASSVTQHQAALSITASQLSDQSAGTDITADLEEEGAINATAVTGNAADDQVLLGSGASSLAYATIPDCNTEQMLTYAQSTNTFGCEADSTSAGGGYDTIQDEGTGLTQRTTLNFAGAGVVCADDTTRTTCTISGGGSGVTVEEADAAPSVTATTIQFDQADGFTVTDETGGQVQIDLVNAPDAAVADDITLTNITQITTRSHASLQDLTADDHTQYALLAGRSGGQVIIGGTGVGDDLTLQTTSNASKGSYILSELTTNGLLSTTGAAGVLAVDTTDYEEEGQINATAVTGNAADDQVILGSGASAAAYATIPDCNTENMLTYTASTNTFGCESDTGGAGGGDAIEIEDGDNLGTFTAVDTTARFDDAGDINFVFTDGGVGGPDVVTATVRADSVALTTDTTGNYTATIADAGNSTIAVVNGTAEGGAVTLDAVDLNCTDCIGTTEIADSYVLNAGDAIAGNLDFNDGVGDTPAATFTPQTGTAFSVFVEDTTDDMRVTANTTTTENVEFENAGTGLMDVLVETADGVLTSVKDAGVLTGGTLADARVDGSLEADELVLAGDVDGTANANDIDEVAVETELESVLDLPDLQGQIGDAQIADSAVDGGTGGEIQDGTVAPVDMTTAARAVDKSINIFDPTTSDTNKIQWDYGAAVTIQEVHCSTDVGTVTIQLDERVKTTPNTAGTDVMTASLVCDSDDQSTASFTNAGIAADAPVNLQITATATSPTVVRIHVQAQRD